MVDPTGPRVFAVADDLSGAVEAAAALASNRDALVLLGSVDGGADPSANVVVIDTDSRHLPASSAAAALELALASGPARRADHIFVKIDSLLRGPITAVVGVLRASGRSMVVAPAVPAFGRSVRGGRVYVRDVELRRSGAWSVERRKPPESIAAALAPQPVALVNRQQLEDPDLAGGLAGVLADGRVPVCDAEDDADLDRIASAAMRIPRAVLVGAGGLAAAVGRLLYGTADGAVVPGRRERPDAVLVVVGSATPAARSQVAVLKAAGARHVDVAAEDGTSARAPSIEPGVTVLTTIGDTPSVVSPSSRAVELLADRAAAMLRHRPRTDLVVTGGETARRVLDALGVQSLRPFATVHPGAVASRTDAGERVIVTRPGSVGGPSSLDRIVRYLMLPYVKGGSE